MLTTISHRVDSTGGAVAVAHDWGGPTTAPVLLFAHATGLHAHVYAPVVEHLIDRFRCIGIDMRAHGHAKGADDGDMIWTGMRDDLLAVIDALALGGGVDLCVHGHSMGGSALLQAELARPGLFRSMVLYEPILYTERRGMVAGQPWDNPMAAAALRRREVFESRQAAFDNYAKKPPYGDVDRSALEQYVEHGFVDLPDGTVRLACRAEDEASTFSNSSTGVFDRLGEIRCPVTILAGEFTQRQVHYDPNQAAAAKMPKGRFIESRDRTHFGPMERAHEYAETIAAILTNS